MKNPTKEMYFVVLSLKSSLFCIRNIKKMNGNAPTENYFMAVGQNFFNRQQYGL